VLPFKPLGWDLGDRPSEAVSLHQPFKAVGEAFGGCNRDGVDHSARKQAKTVRSVVRWHACDPVQ
jgi:hypothetical protein